MKTIEIDSVEEDIILSLLGTARKIANGCKEECEGCPIRTACDIRGRRPTRLCESLADLEIYIRDKDEEETIATTKPSIME